MKPILKKICSLVCFFVFLFAVHETIHSEPKNKSKTLHPKIMNKFIDAIEKFKKSCAKNPNGPFCKALQASEDIQTNVETDAIVCIGKCLQKDERVGPLAQKITEKLNQKKDVVQDCFFGNDKKSFKQFEKLLRNTTLKCGGVSCLWNKKTCQAAAFAAAAQCLECEK